MNEILKRQVAQHALKYIKHGDIVGVGTGSTVNFFIDQLVQIKNDIEGVVASSEVSKSLLLNAGIRVFDANAVAEISVYIDGADEVDKRGYCIKGGGGALTREKILAALANNFVCIVDQSKIVPILGANFPVAIEVLAEARSYVARACVTLGGNPVYREGFTTDNGNIIIDVYGLDLSDITTIDAELNNIVGVVCHGVFVAQCPDKILVASSTGTSELDIS